MNKTSALPISGFLHNEIFHENHGRTRMELKEVIEMQRGITSNEWVSELQALSATSLLLGEQLSLCLLMKCMWTWRHISSAPLTSLCWSYNEGHRNECGWVGPPPVAGARLHKESVLTLRHLCGTLVWLTSGCCVSCASGLVPSLSPPCPTQPRAELHLLYSQPAHPPGYPDTFSEFA